MWNWLKRMLACEPTPVHPVGNGVSVQSKGSQKIVINSKGMTVYADDPVITNPNNVPVTVLPAEKK